MRNIPTKVDGVDTLPAAEFNANESELENTVTSTGQSLDAAAGPDSDLNMLAKAASIYAQSSMSYVDSGSADAYVVTKQLTTLKEADSYYPGMQVEFIVGNTNTGASTINVSTLGVKNLTQPGGGALVAGDLVTGGIVKARYNGTQFETIGSVVASASDLNQWDGKTGVNTVDAQSIGGTKTFTDDIVRYNSSGPSVIESHGSGDTYDFSRLILKSDEAVDKAWSINHRVSPLNGFLLYYDNGSSALSSLSVDTSGNANFPVSVATGGKKILHDAPLFGSNLGAPTINTTGVFVASVSGTVAVGDIGIATTQIDWGTFTNGIFSQALTCTDFNFFSGFTGCYNSLSNLSGASPADDIIQTTSAPFIVTSAGSFTLSVYANKLYGTSSPTISIGNCLISVFWLKKA